MKSFWRVGITLSIIVNEYKGPITDLLSEGFIELIGKNQQNNTEAPHIFLSSSKLQQIIVKQESTTKNNVRIIEGSRYCLDLSVKYLFSKLIIISDPADQTKFEIGLQIIKGENLNSEGRHDFQISRPEIMGISAEEMSKLKYR